MSYPKRLAALLALLFVIGSQTATAQSYIQAAACYLSGSNTACLKTVNVASGGTGLASGTSGGVLGYTATGTLASSAALAANAVVIGGGAGATPTGLATGTVGQLMRSAGTSAPAFAFPHTTVAKSASYVITDTDGFETVLVTTGASTITITLPASANNTNRQITIKKVDSGAGKVTIARTGGDSIDAYTTTDLTAQYASFTTVADGTNWQVESIMGECQSVVQAVNVTVGTSTHYVDITSLALAPGQWQINANSLLSGGGGFTETRAVIFIGTTSGDNSTGLVNGDNNSDFDVAVTAVNTSLVVPGYKVFPTTATTYYLKGRADYGAGTGSWGGRLTACRLGP